jgi:hypothetical protein
MKPFAAALLLIFLSYCHLCSAFQTSEPTSAKPYPGLIATWIGQNLIEPIDLTNRSAAVGPDGFEDIQVELRGLIVNSEIESIQIETTGGNNRWAYGKNPQIYWNAELIRTPSRGPRAILVLSVPLRDTDKFAGSLIKIKVIYSGGVFSETTVLTGKVEPDLAMPVPPLPPIRISKAEPVWVGPVSGSKAGQGAVRVEINGLPTVPRIESITLTEPSGTLFFADFGRHKNHLTQARELVVESLDQSRLRLDFLPNRNLNGQKISICLTLSDKSLHILNLTGGPTDLTRQIPDVGPQLTKANPSTDLQVSADRGGTIELVTGVYKLNKPLILRKPLRIVAAEGSRPVLRFSSDDHQFWTSAIRICSSGVLLEGFDIECLENIDWNTEIIGGPAIIISSNQADKTSHIEHLLTGIRLQRLKIRSQSVLRSLQKNEIPESVRLIRMTNVTQGVIEGNVFQGGGISINGGPWLIRQNRYHGPPDSSTVNELVSAHRAVDLVVESNRIEPLPDSGEIRKFLHLTGHATGVRVSGNLVRNVGQKVPRNEIIDADLPIIESGSRRVKFEGEPLQISPDGKVVTLPPIMEESPVAGDILAILSGNKVGSYHLVLQNLGMGAILIDPPLQIKELAMNLPAVCLTSGFKDVFIYKNSIEARSGNATHISLSGNHFNTLLIDNQLENGGKSLSIVSPATDSPMYTGWTHAPLFGLVIHGNKTRDPLQPLLISVAAGKDVKSFENRVYLTGRLSSNQLSLPPGGHPIIIGDEGSKALQSLILNMTGNQTGSGTAEVKINAATINGQAIIQKTIPLTTTDPIQTTGR